MRVEAVVLLLAKEDSPGNVLPGLIRVRPYDPPPPGDGRPLDAGGRDRANELTDDLLLRILPCPVPNDVDGNVIRHDRSIVILEVDEL